MQTVIRLNPWLGAILSVEANRVVNVAQGHPGEGSKLEIFTSDVGSSYGILPDLIIADELVHWEGDGSLWHSLISSAAKRSSCLLVVISNAGMAETWQWNVREAARTDQSWYFSRLNGPQASWLTTARLEEQRRMLPRMAFARLWLNEWSSGLGDALSQADIDAAFHSDLGPMTGREQGWLFVGGVDLGLTRDCSAVVVLGIPDGGRGTKIRLANTKLWRPTAGRKIDLTEVELHLLALDEQYGLEFVAFDPWQAELLSQRLEAHSDHRRRNQRRLFGSQPWMREIPPTAANLREQAGLVIESFADRRLLLYAEAEALRRDLRKLRCEEKSYGIRLVSPHDEYGHGDTFSAFANALLVAHEIAGKRPNIVRSLTSDGPLDETPLQRALREHDYEREAYQREMQDLHQAGADYSGRGQWLEIMDRFGRI
jgi:hypothetical protein